jgi:MoxR-like ATPase
MPFESIDQLVVSLRDQLYLADRGLATSIYLSLKLERPLFLEGEAGVGKTEVAKALAASLDTELIRLQCYEGLDVHHAVYEWNYTRQMLHIRMLEARGERPEEKDLFGSEFLLSRPLLQAIEWEGDRPPVLLIDELDRSDEEFEAFLLEILSEFQVTIPEIGTIRADRRPVAVITSNRTREVHDALKRRCLYHWIDYPSFDREAPLSLSLDRLSILRPRVRDFKAEASRCTGATDKAGHRLRAESARRGPV